MKVLLDVPVEGLKKYIQSQGYDVITATEKGIIPDEKLIQYAKENDCILITEDKKAYKIASEKGIRTVPVNVELIADSVNRSLEKIRYESIMRTAFTKEILDELEEQLCSDCRIRLKEILSRPKWRNENV